MVQVAAEESGGGGGGGGEAARAGHDDRAAAMLCRIRAVQANDPADANWWRKVPSLSFVPSRRPATRRARVRAVLRFVQQTVEPGATVTDAGEYEIPRSRPLYHPLDTRPARASEPKPITIAAAIPQAPVRAASAFMPGTTAVRRGGFTRGRNVRSGA